ncbi:MAG: hypothetical protein AAGA54_19925 [Myxococcota bacterium]
MEAAYRWFAVVGHLVSMAAALVASLPLADRVAPQRFAYVFGRIGAALPTVPPTDAWPGPLFAASVVVVAVLAVPAMLVVGLLGSYGAIRLVFGPVLAALRQQESQPRGSAGRWLVAVLLPWAVAGLFAWSGTPPGLALLGALVTYGFADVVLLVRADAREWVRILRGGAVTWMRLGRGLMLLGVEAGVLGLLYALLWVSESDPAWLAFDHGLLVVEVVLLWPLYAGGAPLSLFE